VIAVLFDRIFIIVVLLLLALQLRWCTTIVAGRFIFRLGRAIDFAGFILKTFRLQVATFFLLVRARSGTL